MDLEKTKNSTRERFLHRLRYSYRSYDLISSNLFKAVPVFFRNRRLRTEILHFPASIGQPFVISVTGQDLDFQTIRSCLANLGLDQVGMSVASSEIEQLHRHEKLLSELHAEGIESTVSLLQQRQDVMDPDRWKGFVQEVFFRLGKISANFVIGHAWNSLEGGVYDHQEYLQLAHAAFSAAEGQSLSLVGPAVTGFHFWLYPPLLKILPFDRISCQLDISRETDMSRPNIGNNFLKKLTRLKAGIEVSSKRGKGLWLTDLGRPVLDEAGESDLLIRFLVPVLSTGLVEKIFLPWPEGSGFPALKTLVSFLGSSVFEGRFVHPEAEIFVFCKAKEVFAVGWTGGKSVEYEFPGELKKVFTRDGDELPVTSRGVVLDGHPRYVILAAD